MAIIEAPLKITDAEREFAEAYVMGKSLYDAARAAGKHGKDAGSWALNALQRPRVREYMDAVRKVTALSVERAGRVALPTTKPVYVKMAEAIDVRRKLTEILYSDIGSILELVDDPGVIDPKTGKPVKRAIVSLEKAIANKVTHLIEEIAITKDGIRVKFIRKMEAINALIRVLGMEEASEADRAKERASMAEALANLPPEVVELLARHSLGPPRVIGNGNGDPQT